MSETSMFDPTVPPETATETPEAEAPVYPPRAFHRSDYRRFAAAIKRTRHVMHDPFTAKDAELLGRVDALTAAVAELFTADSDAFDAAKFVGSTALDTAPDYVPDYAPDYAPDSE